MAATAVSMTEAERMERFAQLDTDMREQLKELANLLASQAQRSNGNGSGNGNSSDWKSAPRWFHVLAISVLVLQLGNAGLTITNLRSADQARRDEEGREIKKEVPSLRSDVELLKWQVNSHVKAIDEQRVMITDIWNERMTELREKAVRRGDWEKVERLDDRIQATTGKRALPAPSPSPMPTTPPKPQPSHTP